MNLLEVKKATVKVQAILDIIRCVSDDRLRTITERRSAEPKSAPTPESEAYDKGWKNGLNAGVKCGQIEIQDLDAGEIIEALNSSEED